MVHLQSQAANQQLVTTDTPPLMNEPPTADIDPIQVDINGIVELLNSLETHEAAGPDEIPAQFLKEFSELLAPSLTVVFQASLNQCSLPSDWKRAYQWRIQGGFIGFHGNPL